MKHKCSLAESDRRELATHNEAWLIDEKKRQTLLEAKSHIVLPDISAIEVRAPLYPPGDAAGNAMFEEAARQWPRTVRNHHLSDDDGEDERSED
jgi:hypothetical protein